MKRTHTFQLKALTFLLLSFCFLTAQAQRKFRFGLGINYALPIERYTSGETRLGVYLNGTYRLADRLDVGLTASLDEPSSLFTNRMGRCSATKRTRCLLCQT